MMRQVGWAALGIVGGFLIGGLAPRMEVAALHAAQEDLKDQLYEAQQNAVGGRRGSMLPVPGMSEMFEPSERPERPARPSPSSSTDPDAPQDIEEVEFWDSGEPPDVMTPASMGEEFDLAVDAQRARARQSRAALEEQAGLSGDDMVEFDRMVGEMNTALSEYGEDLMALALSGEEPEAEEMLGLTHDVTGILYDTQTQINDLVGADVMGDVDPSARQAWNHIDLDVFRDVVEEME
ncbi:MAG: hypothetical protein ACI8S6_002107 [Myxococcota bacterium]|jgi:hypothetical protein